MQVDQWRKRRCVVIVNETAAKQYNEIIDPFDYWVFILCAYHATDSWNLEYYMFLNFRISLTVYTKIFTFNKMIFETVVKLYISSFV